jgi:NAD(P)-dependent dehydrogenase (short-subunit alcohol dehydrogenase family)
MQQAPQGRVGGKRALVTGAGRGVGQAIAQLLAREGAAVACVDLDGTAAQATAAAIRAAGGNAIGLTADVTSARAAEDCVQAANAKFGGLDILVNNVGTGGHGTIETTSEQEWDRVMGANPKSVFLVSRFALPLLRASGRSAILNIASGVGVRASRNWAAYGTSKSAVVALTKLMALDHAGDGIRVNCVCPGLIETDLSRKNLEDSARQRGISVEQATRQAQGNYPLGRFGQPSDIAYAALYLVSDEAAWVTGSVLVVDGGRCAG